MSVSTGARLDTAIGRKNAEVVAHRIGNVKANKGTLINTRVADGFVYPGRNGTASDVFRGVADETIDNSAGSAGATIIRLNLYGSYLFAAAWTAAQTDNGQAVYIYDDQTVTLTSTNAQLCGYIEEVISSTQVRVRIDQAAR